MQIDYAAPQAVRDLVGALGRTEDLRLSPDNRRLAVAGFSRDRISVFEIEIGAFEAGTRVSLSGALELSSPVLKRPHGVDFIDNDTLAVANRRGDVAVFALPPGEPGARAIELAPIGCWRAGESPDGTTSPGSLAVTALDDATREVLICNNYVHTVTRHRLELPAAGVPVRDEVLLRKWLDIPDGVTVSRDRRWLAISNHSTHRVLVYDYSRPLTADSDPVAVLRGVSYPHGLRFSADSRQLFVADAGAPAVQVYAQGGGGWCGVHRPVSTLSAMDDAVFERGHVNPQEGGPKGVDVSDDSTVLVTTAAFQPLAFHELPVVEAAVATVAGGSAGGQLTTDARAVAAELELMTVEGRATATTQALEARALAAEAEVQRLTSSTSWRVTAPLRGLRSISRRLR